MIAQNFIVDYWKTLTRLKQTLLTLLILLKNYLSLKAPKKKLNLHMDDLAHDEPPPQGLHYLPSSLISQYDKAWVKHFGNILKM